MIKKIMLGMLCFNFVFAFLTCTFAENVKAELQATDLGVEEDVQMQSGIAEQEENSQNQQNNFMFSPEGFQNIDVANGGANPFPMPGDENFNPMQNGGMGGGFPGQIPQQNQNSGAQTETQNQSGILNFISEYSTPIISVVLLALAFVFVKFYKRKMY